MGSSGKRKFKMLDPSTNTKRSYKSMMDTKDDRCKELLVIGYVRQFVHANTECILVESIIRTFCQGLSGSVYWKLSKYEINAILEDEDNERMFFKQLCVPRSQFFDNCGDIIFDLSVSRCGDMLSFYVNCSENNMCASIYALCITNGRMCKRIYNSTSDKQTEEVVMNLMNMRHYEQQNLIAFEEAFLALNDNARKSAKYFQIPTVVSEEDLEFVFHAKILS